MKKIIALMLILVLAFAFVGCGKKADHNHDHNHSQVEVASNTKPVTKPLTDAPAFSYENDKDRYTKENFGMLVHTEGFKNTKEATVTTVKEAIELAKKECTAEYDSVDVRYDAKAKVTMVCFYLEGALGGGQSVYFDENGKTLLIVYGE